MVAVTRKAPATSATSATKASTSAKATRSASITVLTNIKSATLPIVAVELGDSIPAVLGCLERDNTGTLGTAIGGNVNISADDLTGISSLAEEILQVLPADVVWKLKRTSQHKAQ